MTSKFETLNHLTKLRDQVIETKRETTSKLNKLRDQITQTIKIVKNDYWSFVDDDEEIYDADFDSQEEVLEFLSRRMYKELEDSGTVSITAETEEPVVLVRYGYDCETNERVIAERVESTASCVGLGQ